jgi:hypothetical protein
MGHILFGWNQYIGGEGGLLLHPQIIPFPATSFPFSN